MTTPVNLNRFRKAKARAEKERKARENRVKFGRTKAEKAIEKARADKLTRLTDGHRLKDEPDERG